MNVYDSVRYTTHSDPDTHPDRLAVIGKLFGLDPAPITKCNVLEVGCGDGSNLIPMSWALPGSQFVGIDLASSPVASGNEMISRLGLGNIRLVNGNIMDVDESWGQFDYIIAHGFYSWVPGEVRDHLLKVCRRCLASHGIAFVSYNAFPGSHLRNLTREMMLFHTRDVESPSERVQQAKALLSLVANAQTGRDDGQLLIAEARRTLEHTDAHMYHDDLAEINHAVYFSQFMAHAGAFGLRFVGEADYFEMSDHTFAPTVRDALGKIRANRLLYEQYLDFLKCRRFRQTLLCLEDAPARSEPTATAIDGFLISSTAAAAPRDPDSDTTVYATKKGARVETDHQVGLAALAELEQSWPHAVPFSQLAAAVSRRVSRTESIAVADQDVAEQLRDFLLTIYSAGVVEFHTYLPHAGGSSSDHPRASPVARLQLERGSALTTLYHDTLAVEDPVEKQLVGMLDGTRDHGAIRDALYDFLKEAGAFADGIPEERCREQVGMALERNLEKLARLGLLVGGNRESDY